ncbi:MAG TPA: SCP2 sterol-binding domain-containing protein [Steroidobacteraceae bacterium]|nr:SCP2 sterol-binding domain-containing protein [Steroidobacteraceae bacterium]
MLLPRSLVGAVATRVFGSVTRSHPRLPRNLAALDQATVHVMPNDLPYGFALAFGGGAPRLTLVPLDADGADATVRADTRVLVDLLEGRIDSDSLFFRRDLSICGDTAVVVGLRNVLDREPLVLADELAGSLGRWAPASRLLARTLNGWLERLGSRVAAAHRALHPREPDAGAGAGVIAELERQRAEIAALTARIGKFEARQKRREEKSP